MNVTDLSQTPTEPATIGIIGGMGPFAHIELERRLLGALGQCARDQDYPAWMVSSIPATPSLAGALFEGGASPVPAMVESAARLHPGADFAVIACNTAHAFWDAVAARAPLPLMHLIEEVVDAVADAVGEGATVGVMGVSAMLRAEVYPRVAQVRAPSLRWLTLPGLEGGARLQEGLTMRPIYGPLGPGGVRARGGLKDGGSVDPETGRPHREAFAEAVERLAAAGAACVVAGCTEISLALGPAAAVPVIDPLAVAATAALAIARGERPVRIVSR